MTLVELARTLGPDESVTLRRDGSYLRVWVGLTSGAGYQIVQTYHARLELVTDDMLEVELERMRKHADAR